MVTFEGDRTTYYVPRDEARSLGRMMWVMGFASGLLVSGIIAVVGLGLWWPT